MYEMLRACSSLSALKWLHFNPITEDRRWVTGVVEDDFEDICGGRRLLIVQMEHFGGPFAPDHEEKKQQSYQNARRVNFFRLSFFD